MQNTDCLCLGRFLKPINFKQQSEAKPVLEMEGTETPNDPLMVGGGDTAVPEVTPTHWHQSFVQIISLYFTGLK